MTLDGLLRPNHGIDGTEPTEASLPVPPFPLLGRPLPPACAWVGRPPLNSAVQGRLVGGASTCPWVSAPACSSSALQGPVSCAGGPWSHPPGRRRRRRKRRSAAHRRRNRPPAHCLRRSALCHRRPARRPASPTRRCPSAAPTNTRTPASQPTSTRCARPCRTCQAARSGRLARWGRVPVLERGEGDGAPTTRPTA